MNIGHGWIAFVEHSSAAEMKWKRKVVLLLICSLCQSALGSLLFLLKFHEGQQGQGSDVVHSYQDYYECYRSQGCRASHAVHLNLGYYVYWQSQGCSASAQRLTLKFVKDPNHKFCL